MALTLDSPAERIAPLRVLKARIGGWGFHLATRLILDAFLMFECTVDARVYGMERLREIKRAGRSPLLVMWHGQGLMPISLFRGERLCLYASHDRNPNYAPHLQRLRWWTLRLIEQMGYRVLDAAQFKSESRGVLQFVELLRSGTGSVIAADGPQGPIYKAKPGPPFLAKKAGVLLLPIGAALSGGFRLDQWDQFEIPWPFSRAVLCLGEPIEVPAKAKDEELERIRLHLEQEMNRLVEEAQRRLNATNLQPAQQVKGQHAERGQQPGDQEGIEKKQPG